MLPSWVKHRDGRLVPFESDAISDRLFAAAQTLGPADAFLVRELTDGILHFLGREDLPDTAPSQQIDEVVEKVVRELGHPDLAEAFGERRPPVVLDRTPLTVPFSPADDPAEIAGRAIEAFSMRSIYAPHVAAAHQQGLIRLGGLRSPRLLEAIVLDPLADPSEAMSQAAARAAAGFVLDSPEWLAAGDIAEYVNALDSAAASNGVVVDVHLNAAEPPAWAQARAAGPLFEAAPGPRSPSAEWLEAIRSTNHLRVAWHLRQAEVALPRTCSVFFERVSSIASPIALSHGLNRRRPAILTAVGLDLSALLNRPDVSCQSDVFLEKLPSLSRLAVSAGVQKRTYLRRHAEDLSRGFLLDRAALRLEPVGVSAVVQQLLGLGAPTSKPARTLARAILAALADPLADARRRTGLDIILGEPDFAEATRDTLPVYDEIGKGVVAAECHAASIERDMALVRAAKDTSLTVVHIQ